VSVALLPGRSRSVDGEGTRVKLPAVVTVREMVVLALSEPEVPVTTTADVPAMAELLVVSVSTLLPEVGFVLNAAVTPPGKPYIPDALRVTLPVNPPDPVTVIVSVALAPWAIDKVDNEDLSVKLGVAATLQAVPLSENDVGTAFVVPFHVPLNPTPV